MPTNLHPAKAIGFVFPWSCFSARNDRRNSNAHRIQRSFPYRLLILSNNNNSDYIEEDVLSSVNSFISDHRMALESFGITRGDDGKLEIDSDALATAVSENLSGVKDAFGGFDGLAVRVHNYASHISTDSPLNYAKEAENISIEFADYLYTASVGMMKQALTGSLLNSYI